MSKRRSDSMKPRKRRPGTQPLKDAHPAATGGEVIIRKLTPEQLREYRRSGVLPLSQDIPLVGIAPVPVLPPRAGSPWLKRSPDSSGIATATIVRIEAGLDVRPASILRITESLGVEPMAISEYAHLRGQENETTAQD